MDLLALIPLPWKIGGIVAIGLALFGGYEGWAYHERTLGAAKLEAANQKAIVAQQAKDAKLSTALLVKLQAENTQLQAIATKGIGKIDLEPVQPGSPQEQDAAEAIRSMLGAK